MIWKRQVYRHGIMVGFFGRTPDYIYISQNPTLKQIGRSSFAKKEKKRRTSTKQLRMVINET